jgi:hypothetical protein
MSAPTPPDRPRTRPRQWIALVIIAALVAVLVVLVAVIDSSETTQSIGSDAARAPSAEDSSVAPAPTSAPASSAPASSAPASSAPASSAPATTARKLAPLPAPTADSPLRLWVGGDSLAAGPSWAVFELAQDTGVVKTLAEYQVGTGLNRDEFWDWPKHMDAVVRARDPQVTVFMVGANDDQPITADGQAYAPPDPKFIEEYRRRVATLMTTLTADGRRLIWIAMPPMRDAEYSASMGLIDQVMAEEAAKRSRVAYVDTYAMFSEPGAVGTYAQSVPDESGQLVDMRLDDGIHLNVAGSQFLARAVMAELAKFVNLPPA